MPEIKVGKLLRVLRIFVERQCLDELKFRKRRRR